MPEPSIKATAFQSVADDLNRLVEAGRLGREELEARLEAEDLPFIDEKLSPTTWVPVGTYQRGTELLVAKEAPNHGEEYLAERGARAADRLAALGMYSQLDATTQNLGQRIGHMIISLARAIYSFGEWSFEPQGNDVGFEIRVTEVGALPEVARFATRGFIQRTAERASGRPLCVVSIRRTPDTIVYLAKTTR